ncbi:unnamed protein product [Linum trigynum]|uniref:Uncharacterized protein n=1 Tax=Linum trigynum TaxID=586398 RepID=A0AAV2CJL9_9ROSI
MSGVLIHPQWCNLLSIDDLIYREVCVELYSTFIHEVPTNKRNRSYVDFMLEEHHHILTYDGFTQAMSLDTTLITMSEREYARDFKHHESYLTICHQEHQGHQF